MKKLFYTVFSVLVLAVSPVLAQDCNPEFENCEIDDVPLDGGVSILVAAGIAYGASQLRKKQHDETQAV